MGLKIRYFLKWLSLRRLVKFERRHLWEDLWIFKGAQGNKNNGYDTMYDFNNLTYCNSPVSVFHTALYTSNTWCKLYSMQWHWRYIPTVVRVRLACAIHIIYVVYIVFHAVTLMQYSHCCACVPGVPLHISCEIRSTHQVFNTVSRMIRQHVYMLSPTWNREVTSDQLFVILVEIFVVPLNKWENALCSVWLCHFTPWTWLLKFAHFCPL